MLGLLMDFMFTGRGCRSSTGSAAGHAWTLDQHIVKAHIVDINWIMKSGRRGELYFLRGNGGCNIWFLCWVWVMGIPCSAQASLVEVVETQQVCKSRLPPLRTLWPHAFQENDENAGSSAYGGFRSLHLRYLATSCVYLQIASSCICGI